MIEDVSVGRMRAAMNVKDQRIFLVRVEIGRFLDPRLNPLAVEAREPDVVRLGEVQLREKLVVEARQLACVCPAGVGGEKVTDPSRGRKEVDDLASIVRHPI